MADDLLQRLKYVGYPEIRRELAGGRLDAGLRDYVTRGAQAEIHSAWNLVQRWTSRESSEQHFRDAALLLIGTAGIAAALRERAFAELETWWLRGSRAGLTSAIPHDESSDPLAVLTAIWQTLRGPLELKYWTQYWLSDPQTWVPGERYCEVSVAYADDASGQGHIGTIELGLLPEAEVGYILHPGIALWRIKDDLRCVFADHCTATGSGVIFRLWPAEKHHDLRITWEGDSLGGAVAASIRVLQDKLAFDRSSLILAAARNDKLLPVGALEEKIEAARRDGIRSVAVSSETAGLDQLAAKFPGVQLYRLTTVEDAVRFLSGLSTEMICWLRTETNRVILEARRKVGRDFSDWASVESILVERYVASSEDALASKTGPVLEEQLEQGQLEGPHYLEWDQVWARRKRGVVLSPPGFGKSALVWRVVGNRNEWEVNQIELGRSLNDVEPSIFFTARELAEAVGKTGNLLEAILARQAKVTAGPLGTLLREKLENGQLLVAIDALDECNTEERTRLERVLSDLGSDARVLVTSRPSGYVGLPGFTNKENEFVLLPFSGVQTREAVQFWFGADAEASARVLAWLESMRMTPLDLGSPLLLRLACQVAVRKMKDFGQLPLLQRQTDLYEEILNGWLQDWASNKGWSQRDERVVSLRRLAEELSWNLLVQEPSSAGMTRDVLAAAAERIWSRYERLDELRDRIVDELCACGVLTVEGTDRDRNPPLAYTHKTIGEFLAGGYLARQLERNSTPSWDEMERISWRPTHEPVLIFAAGSLHALAPALDFLTRLADPRADDAFRPRLALAGKCLPELRGLMAVSRDLVAKRDEIAALIIQHWRKFYSQNLAEQAGRMVACLGPLARSGAVIDGQTVLEWLLELMKEQDTRDLGSWALREIGPAGALPEIVRLLGQELKEAAWERREVAAAVLQSQHGIGASCDELAGLVAMLEDDSKPHHLSFNTITQFMISGYNAAEALGDMAGVQLPNELFSRLWHLVDSPDSRLRDALFAAFRKRPAERYSIISWSLRCVESEDEHERRVGAYVLGQLGKPAALAEVEVALDHMLQDESPAVRIRAASALARLGTPRVSCRLQDLVAGWLHSPAVEEFQAATDIIGVLKANGAIDPILNALVNLLGHPDVSRAKEAAHALSAIGPDAATPAVCDALESALDHSETEVRYAAARAFAFLKPSRLSDGIVQRLPKLLNDDQLVYDNAVHLAASAGSRAANAPVIERLIELLIPTEFSGNTAGTAATALASMDYLDDRVLARLVNLMNVCPNSPARWEAAEALVRLNSPRLLRFWMLLWKWGRWPLSQLARLRKQADWRYRFSSLRAGLCQGIERLRIAESQELLQVVNLSLNDPDSNVRDMALYALSTADPALMNPGHLATVYRLSRDADASVRRRAGVLIAQFHAQGWAFFDRGRRKPRIERKFIGPVGQSTVN